MKSLIDSIKMNFDFLFKDYGFVFSEKSDERTDWVVVVILGLLRIRFIEDRANIFADISFTYEPDLWYELSSVLLLLKKINSREGEVRVGNNIASLRSVLKSNLDELIYAVNRQEFREDVSKLKSM